MSQPASPRGAPAPTVALRTTAGRATGLGHLRRCLTLAGALREAGARTVFWLDGDEAGPALAASLGHEVALPRGVEPAATLALCAPAPDALVVDGYDFDESFLRALRPRVRALLALDDLADRFLDADLVLNAGLQAPDLPYRVAEGCRLLLGPTYALLRPGFRDHPPRALLAEVGRVLVTLGGGDTGALAGEVVGGLLALPGDFAIDVVLGPLCGEGDRLPTEAARAPGRLRLHRALPDLVDLMAAADLAVTGGGQTLFELAACGLPAVALRLADNQAEQLAGFARAATVLDAGEAGAPDFPSRLARSVARLLDDADLRRAMSRAGQRLVDGRGAERAAAALLASLRPAPKEDE